MTSTMTPSDDAWIGLRLGRQDAPLRVVGYPHAGGAASAFSSWRTRLPDDVQLVVLEPPGRWRRHREQPFVRVADAAVDVAPVVRALLDRPTVLFGHSLGSLVMYEVARQLRRDGGAQPVALAVAAKRAPSAKPPARIWALDDDALVAALGRTYGAARLAVLDDAEARAVFLRTLRADLEANGTYPPTQASDLSIPVAAWGGDDDPEAGRDDLLDWARVTAGPFSMAMCRGGHFFVHEPQAAFVPLLARFCRSVVDAAAG